MQAQVWLRCPQGRTVSPLRGRQAREERQITPLGASETGFREVYLISQSKRAPRGLKRAKKGIHEAPLPTT